MKRHAPLKLDEDDFAEGAYISSEAELDLYKLYCIVASSSGCGFTTDYICQDDYQEMLQKKFVKPDWYFFLGDCGDQYGPGSYHFETLEDRKKQIQKLESELDKKNMRMEKRAWILIIFTW